MKIAKRLETGWTDRQPNKHKYICDDCGARLWVAPDGKSVYCNVASDKHRETTMTNTDFTYDCQCPEHEGNAINLPDDKFPSKESTAEYGLNPEWCWGCNRKARVKMMEQ